MAKIGIQAVQALELEMLKAVLAIFDKHAIPYYGVYGTTLGAVRHQGTIPWDYDIDLGIPYPHYARMIDCLRMELDARYQVYFHDSNPDYFFLFGRVGYRGVSHGYLHVDLFPLVGAPCEESKRRKMLNTFETLYRFYPMKKHKPVWARTPIRRVIKQGLYEIRQAFYPRSAEQLIQRYEAACSEIPWDEASYVYTACPEEGMKSFMPKGVLAEGILMPYHDLSLRIPFDYHTYLRILYGDYGEFPPKEEQAKGMSFSMEVPQSLVQ